MSIGTGRDQRLSRRIVPSPMLVAMNEETEQARPVRLRAIRDGDVVSEVDCADRDEADRLIETWESPAGLHFEIEPILPIDEVEASEGGGEADYPHG